MEAQSLKDISDNGVDATKHIMGRVKMAWDSKGPNRSIEALVTVQEQAFRVYFQLADEHLDVLQDLGPKHRFHLSLRGATLQKLKSIPRLSTVPLSLTYSDGVEVKWKQNDGGIRSLNTWKENDENAWFSSPQAVKESIRPHAPKRHREETGTPEMLRDTPPTRQKLSGPEKKKRRLDEKELAIAAEKNLRRASTGSPSLPMDFYSSQPLNNEVNSSQTASSKLKAGLRLGSNFYPAIGDVRVGSFANLVGVVRSISAPTYTHKGDWMRFVQIVDPSNHNENPSGMKINCFTKQHVEWLPNAEIGDVVILRSVKIQTFKESAVGTGYNDKLSWAAWSPPGRIHHGPPNNAPRGGGLAAGGFGVFFSPFYEPGREEILYCVKLSDWWREVQKEEEKYLVHIPPATSYSTAAVKRVHRLISDAGPSVPPDGYFDCTVEILHGHMNEGGVYSLMVTDYTRNEQTGDIQSNFYPLSLSDKALRIEMWDAAADAGQSMKPGEYYCIRNARMVTNQYSGYLQAKLQQNKIIRLKESDANTNQFFKALLERKKQWEQNQPDTYEEIEHRLIERFEKEKFLSCTVEILQAATDTKDGSFICVTDYTSHPLLKSLKITEPWAQGMTGYILKIFLVEGQKTIAASIEVGSLYRIQKLRWKYSHMDDCIRAQLGGTDKLISKLNPNRTDNEHLNGLLRRKEAWEENIQRLPLLPHQIPEADNNEETEHDPTCILIKDIPPPQAGPMQLKVYGKVVSFYPMSLDDASYQYCGRCKIEIPPNRIACVKCGDFEHDYVEIKYQIYIMVEDKEGEQILVSINDSSDIWGGLKRVNLRDDDHAAKQLRTRLSPLIGNLPLVHEYYCSGQTIEKRTSFVALDLDSWVDDVKGRGYNLKEYK